MFKDKNDEMINELKGEIRVIQTHKKDNVFKFETSSIG